MPLRNITERERFDNFEDAAALRDWLNRFKTTDLRNVSLENLSGEPVNLSWETELLSDGSTVNNIVIG